MPRLLRDFPASEPALLHTFSIDFVLRVPPGLSIASAYWTLALHDLAPGAAFDAAPMSRLQGATDIQGTVTLQDIVGLIAGNDYLVSAFATFSDGTGDCLWTVLPCRAPQ